MTPQGTVVWRELLTTDLAAACTFYSALFGWTIKEAPMGDSETYTLFGEPTGGLEVAGAMTHPAPGVPSHWMDYLYVAKVEPVLARALELGATHIGEIITVPNIGRMTWVQDPVGAVFGLFEVIDQGDPPPAPQVGSFCWSQLNTRDLDRAVAFYTGLFGWTAAPMMPGTVVFNEGDVGRASAMQSPPDAPPVSYWLQYVAVDDTDATFQRALQLGARAYVPPTTVEGMGRFAVLADPSGGTFALWKDLHGGG